MTIKINKIIHLDLSSLSLRTALCEPIITELIQKEIEEYNVTLILNRFEQVINFSCYVPYIYNYSPSNSKLVKRDVFAIIQLLPCIYITRHYHYLILNSWDLKYVHTNK